MHDKIVLDSSVIAAIFFPETITGKAIEAAAGHPCITADLAYPEVANVAWKRVVQAKNDPGLMKTFLDDAFSFIRETCEVIPAYDLNTPAWDLACCHKITQYDAIFIAAAIRCHASLVTADKKLAGAAGNICPVILLQ